MQFNRCEGCFVQPYSHGPVDAAPTNYPWNHGITGYFPRTHNNTELRDFRAVKTIFPCARRWGISNHCIDVRTYNYCGKGKMSLHNAVTGKRVTQSAKGEDCTLRTRIAWRTQLYAGIGRRHSSPG
jgi:hypothetical protein